MMATDIVGNFGTYFIWGIGYQRINQHRRDDADDGAKIFIIYLTDYAM